MSLRCDLLDTAVSTRVLSVLQPAQIEVAVEALRQLEHRDTAMSGQWRMRLERAEYEAQLAQRRYEEVDPSNRLVAATLEQRWNDALVRLEEVRTQFADFQSREALVVTPEQRARVAALAHDFPRLWNAPTTKTQDKKRILRLVIKDITVERFGERRLAVLHVRWQGGACEDIEVTLPDNIADRLRYPEEIIDRVRELARERTDEDVAAALNGEGRRSAKDESFNVSMIRWIRYKHRIPAPVFHRPGERSVRQVLLSCAQFQLRRLGDQPCQHVERDAAVLVLQRRPHVRSGAPGLQKAEVQLHCSSSVSMRRRRASTIVRACNNSVMPARRRAVPELWSFGPADVASVQAIGTNRRLPSGNTNKNWCRRCRYIRLRTARRRPLNG